jgi:hypothetical protein
MNPTTDVRGGRVSMNKLGGPIVRLAFLGPSPATRSVMSLGITVAIQLRMLKLIGSYAIAKLLGFGLFGAIVIYALLSLLT